MFVDYMCIFLKLDCKGLRHTLNTKARVHLLLATFLADFGSYALTFYQTKKADALTHQPSNRF